MITIIPELTTDRLRLRGFTEGDFESYAEMCADDRVMHFLGGKPLTRHEAWRSMASMLGHWHLKGYGMWAVVEQGSGETIGRVGCWQPSGWVGLEVGWTIRSQFWGRGYATEAGAASINFAFNELEADSIISYIDPANIASRRVAEKLGETFDKMGTLFDKDIMIYRIDRVTWKNRNPHP
jgi:RimJ/RimL family protein N-acetyltransferase